MLKKFLFIFLFIVFAILIIASHVFVIIVIASYLEYPILGFIDESDLLFGILSIFPLICLIPLSPLAAHSIVFHGKLDAYVNNRTDAGFTNTELLMRMALFVLPILPFIGMFFVKKKPNLYRFFVYIPLLIGIALQLFTNIIPWFTTIEPDYFIIKDIVYLIFAIILDITMRKERARML